MNINESQIREIVEKVVDRVLSEQSLINDSSVNSFGIFDDVDTAITQSIAAQKRLVTLPLSKRGEIIDAMRRVARSEVQKISKMAVEETGLGRYDDKVNKNLLVIDKTPGVEDLKTSAVSGDDGLMIEEMGPYGVIGAITPTTNPSETIINNCISIIAAGNSVFISPHPGAKKVSSYTIQLLNKGIIEAGGPENLLTSISEPSIEAAQYLMKHPGINLLLVTGGPGVVKAAMKSGKKVIGAGPGNPPVVIDETADLQRAAIDIVRGASLDNNIVCIAEKVIIAVDSIADSLKQHLGSSGSVEVKGSQKDAILKVVFENYDPGKPWKELTLSKSMIGKDASLFLEKINVNHSKDVRLIFIEVGKEHPLVLHEQMMPVIPFVRVKDVDEAIALALRVEHGFRHTSVMHSRNIRNLSKMANLVDTTIFVKNGPSFAGLGLGGEGVTSFYIAGPTGEGLTSARTFTRKRRCVLVDYFRII